MPPPLHKYPRTQHLQGSRSQPGDEDLSDVPFSAIAGRFVVAEEKIDGGNSGISFDAEGKLWLQSRGHYLTGGVREKHFNLFKQWASCHADRLRDVLQDRFVMYGEWLYAKHTIFYDRLPHYFMEFDVLDTKTGEFLSTERRHEMLRGLPIVSVPVLWAGPPRRLEDLTSLITTSLYKSGEWREILAREAAERGLEMDRVWTETDQSDIAEGLYIKVEEGGRVVERYKFIRPSFLTAVLDSGEHWLKRPIIPNQLREGVDLFGEKP